MVLSRTNLMLAALAAVVLPAFATISTVDGLELEWGGGAIDSVSYHGESLTQSIAPGGFSFFDYNTSSNFTPFAGTMVSNAFSATADGLKVDAVFTEMGDYIDVQATLESVTGSNRAIWLEFRLPLDSSDWTWWDEINVSRGVSELVPHEQKGDRGFYDIVKPEFRADESGTFYKACENRIVPVPVAANAETAVAMAIPPDAPVNFIGGCDASGLYFRWPIGLSPLTANFPSQAHLRFRIFRADAEWGMREAMEKYYSWWPELYDVDERELERYSENYNLWIHGGNTNSTRAQEAIARHPDKDEYLAYFNFKGAASDIYTAEELVSVSNLKDLMLSNAEYDARIESPDSDITWHGGDNKPEGLDIFHSSRANLPGGQYYINAQDNGAMHYPLNCDPAVSISNLLSQGDYVLGFMADLNTNSIFEGAHFDTVGSWGNYLNFREDHFAFSTHPLTFDLNGLPAEHVRFELYNLLKALRTYGKANDFGVEAAGMKVYTMKNKRHSIPGLEEESTRFFSASQVDSAWHEGNIDGGYGHSDWNKYDPERTFMGRKIYRVSSGNIAKHNEKILNDGDPSNDHLLEPRRAQIEHALASSIAYGLPCVLYWQYFVDNTDSDYDPIISQYHYRDLDLWNAYEPVADQLMVDGWRPITHAAVDVPHTVCERFNDAPPYGFSLWNQETSTPVTIAIDLAALGLETNGLGLSEAVWSNALSNVWVDGHMVLRATTAIESNKAYVLKLDGVEASSPLPVYPAAGSTVTNEMPRFQWRGVNGASGYDIRLSDQTASSEVFNIQGLPNTSYQSVPAETLLPGHQYEWSVAAASIPDTNTYSAAFTAELPVEPVYITNTIETIADTYSRGTSESNFGGATNISTKAGNKEGYLKFYVDALPASVLGLKLFVYTESGVVSPVIYEVADSSWEELELTGANRPGFGAQIQTIDDVPAGTWAEFDVSSYIVSGTNSIGLGTLDPKNQLWVSREGGFAPYLQLVYEDAESSVAISDAYAYGGGFVMQWSSVSGNTYNVFSTTSLVSNVWNLETNILVIGGTGAITTGVDNVSTFYRIEPVK